MDRDLAPDALMPDAFIDDFNAAKGYVISSDRHILVSFRKRAVKSQPDSRTYRGNLITDFGDSCRYYLHNADGDIEEHPADTANDAEKAIDGFFSDNGGFFDGDGNLYKN